MGISFQPLELADIKEMNRQMIDSSGGLYNQEDENLLNINPLQYALTSIQYEVYGQDLYPTIFLKAAHIASRIILGHVFHDGNKRTGIEACRIFLELNGYDLILTMEIADIAIEIASNELSTEEFAHWLEEHSSKVGL